jgi:hypothetical protein
VFRFDSGIGWCVVWFWTALLPLAALPWVSRLTLYQDHRAYLAGIGLAWAGGELFRRVGHALVTSAPRRLVAGLLTAGLASIAVATDAARTVAGATRPLVGAHLDLYPTSVLALNHQALAGSRETARARDAFETSARLA